MAMTWMPTIRHLVTLCSACAIAGGAVCAADSPSVASPSALSGELSTSDGPERPLLSGSRGILAMARARGDTDVLMIIAVQPGKWDAAVKRVQRSAGRVEFQDKGLGYLRVQVPIGQAETLAEDSSVYAADVELAGVMSAPYFADMGEYFSASGPVPTVKGGFDQVRTQQALPEPPQLSAPYSPLRDLGADQFRSHHPTYDGRGVRVAIVDQTPDLLAPELREATALDGKPIPKFYRLETAIHPQEKGMSPYDLHSWVAMDESVEARGHRFAHGGIEYEAPRKAGVFRFGLLDASQPLSLLKTGGSPTDTSKPEPRPVAVLWDEHSGQVWVDTNDNHSFADEHPLRDFNENQDIGVFGVDDPATPRRESIGFGVQVDRPHSFIAINLGIARHGTLILGAGFAKRGKSGRFDGVAPGAQIASFAGNLTLHALIETAIRAMRDPTIDIVVLEEASYYQFAALSDGRMAGAVILSRVAQRYSKPLLLCLGNSPVLSGVEPLAGASGVISVGGMESAENLTAIDGIRVSHGDPKYRMSAIGPVDDGGLKPDVLAPTLLLTTRQGFLFPEYAFWPYFPVGYTLGGGTSTATPTAAAAVALLISAAKQTGLKLTGPEIKYALTSTARYLPGLSAHEQGNGAIDIGRAWTTLQGLHGKLPPQVTFSAPVRHARSLWLTPPNRGRGLYEREGWTKGQHGTRSILITRMSGGAQADAYSLQLVGNDGTYRIDQSTTTLPLNVPVPIEIIIAPQTAGVHSALLEVRAKVSGELAGRMLAAIVAAEPLNAQNDYTVGRSFRMPVSNSTNYYFDVPQGTEALRVDFDSSQIPFSGQMMGPDGAAHPDIIIHRPGTLMVPSPSAGVWEFFFGWSLSLRPPAEPGDSLEPIDWPPARGRFKVTALRSSTDPSQRSVPLADTLKSLQPWLDDADDSRSPVTKSLHATAARGGDQVETINVPANTAYLAIRVDPAKGATGDLDVYVFDCSQQPVTADGADTRPGPEKFALIEKPHAGSHQIVIHPYDVTEPVDYDLIYELIPAKSVVH